MNICALRLHVVARSKKTHRTFDLQFFFFRETFDVRTSFLNIARHQWMTRCRWWTRFIAALCGFGIHRWPEVFMWVSGNEGPICCKVTSRTHGCDCDVPLSVRRESQRAGLGSLSGWLAPAAGALYLGVADWFFSSQGQAETLAHCLHAEFLTMRF